jgi:ABC-2 type transport system permease protein
VAQFAPRGVETASLWGNTEQLRWQPPEPNTIAGDEEEATFMTTIGLRGRPAGFASGRSELTVRGRIVRVYQYRRILKLLVKRDLKVRYAGSILCYFWTVLEPLLMSLVYWVVFTKLFQRNIGYSPYILFLVAGQLPWFWFNGGVTACLRSLRSESQMVRSSNVPREIWVVRTILSKGVEFVFSLPVLAIFAIAYRKAPNWHVVFLPLVWVMVFVLLLGIGLMLAPLAVLVRDIERVIPIILRVMFYMSPVLYSVAVAFKRLPASLDWIYHVNPVVGPLVLARSAFFPQELHWNYVWQSGLSSLVLLVIGIFTFIRLERQVLKEI